MVFKTYYECEERMDYVKCINMLEQVPESLPDLSVFENWCHILKERIGQHEPTSKLPFNERTLRE